MNEKCIRKLTIGSLLFVLCPAASRAGDGVAALQTADPSCPDGSGNIYVDCGNGTVTDNRTGLVWLANAGCLSLVDWYTAMEFVAGLADLPASDPDDCGLSDGSSPGEWRLPSADEWEAMVADAVALGCILSSLGGPPITNDSGTNCWQEGAGNSFSGVVESTYWSSTTAVNAPTTDALDVEFDGDGNVVTTLKLNSDYVWPVRAGQ